MSIEFDEPTFVASSYTQPTDKGITGLVIKIGLAKNAAQANVVMIGLIIILIFVSWFSLNSMSSDQLTGMEIPIDAAGAEEETLP